MPAAYWIEKTSEMLKGKISPKELIFETEEYFKSIGMIWSEILGWSYPNEVERAGMNAGQKTVPAKTIFTAGDGIKKIIKDEFTAEMKDRMREAKRRRENTDGMNEFVDMVANVFPGSTERPF